MIYSASRRTDMVAFYPEEICRRVARSRKLEAIVFWSKDPRNLLTHLGLQAIVRNYPVVLQFTLTGLGGGWWEPHVPCPDQLSACLAELAEILPAGAIRWRFDPLILSSSESDCSDASCVVAEGECMLERFSRMLGLLRGCGIEPEEVTVSFPDAYPRVRERLAALGVRLPVLRRDGKERILSELIRRGGLPLALCCEPELLHLTGVRQAHCVEGALFDRLYGTGLAALPEDHGQRTACGCTYSMDIGSYEMLCHHDCRYCYARPFSDGVDIARVFRKGANG